jgi:hypothetical protein
MSTWKRGFSQNDIKWKQLAAYKRWVRRWEPKSSPWRILAIALESLEAGGCSQVSSAACFYISYLRLLHFYVFNPWQAHVKYRLCVEYNTRFVLNPLTIIVWFFLTLPSTTSEFYLHFSFPRTFGSILCLPLHILSLMCYFYLTLCELCEDFGPSLQIRQ